MPSTRIGISRQITRPGGRNFLDPGRESGHFVYVMNEVRRIGTGGLKDFGRSQWLACGLVAVGLLMGLRAEEPETAGGALRAEDLECWEPGTLLVSGGWEGGGYGLEWTLSVVEVIGPEEVDGKVATAYRHRSLTGLALGDYLRLRTMDDARFMKEFERRHLNEDADWEYRYWQQVRDGAVWYWAEPDDEDDEAEEPDVAVPADLTLGSKFRSFDSDTVIGARDGALKGPWGVCEAVRMDTSYPEEVEDDEVYAGFRVEVWMGRGLSTVSSRTYELDDAEDEEDEDVEDGPPGESLTSEIRLLRVIRPAAADGEEK